MADSGKHLYIVQASVTGAVKVGRSSNPETRLNQLQTGNAQKLVLLAVFPDKGILEKGIHQQIHKHKSNKRGEWFNPDCLYDLPEWIYEKLPFDDHWWKR